MKSKYPKIFEPITIKRMTIKNRVAMTPMGTNYGEFDVGKKMVFQPF